MDEIWAHDQDQLRDPQRRWIRHAYPEGQGFKVPKVRSTARVCGASKQSCVAHTRRNWSVGASKRIAQLDRYLTRSLSYFGLAETTSTFEEMDKWLRRGSEPAAGRNRSVVTCATAICMEAAGVPDQTPNSWQGSMR